MYYLGVYVNRRLFRFDIGEQDTSMKSASCSASLVSASRTTLACEGWEIAALRVDFVFLRLPLSALGLGALLAMRGEARQSRRIE